jgi:hypothetical protein
MPIAGRPCQSTTTFCGWAGLTLTGSVAPGCTRDSRISGTNSVCSAAYGAWPGS